MTSSSTDSRLEINLTPLLDLVLQLIMFFMLTVNFVRVDQANERVDLPVVQSAVPLKSSGDHVVYLNISKDGERLAGGAKLADAAALKAYLRERKADIERVAKARGETGVQVIIVVRAHKDCSWGDVYDTLDECNRAGYQLWRMRVIRQT
jgi:biopolymer transport protein ExbD